LWLLRACKLYWFCATSCVEDQRLELCTLSLCRPYSSFVDSENPSQGEGRDVELDA